MALRSGVRRSACSPRSTSSSAAWRKPKSGSTSPSDCSRRTATANGSHGRADGYGRHPCAHPHFRRRRVHRDGVLSDRPRGGRPDPRQERVGRWQRGARRARRTQGGARPGARGRATRSGGARRAPGLRRTAAREEPRGRAARAAEGLMDPRALAVLIPVIAIGGFFGTVITLILSRAYTARLKAQSQAGGAAAHDDVLAAVEELRREVAELAERVDFTERLLAKARDGEAGKLGPGERRTGST